MPDIRQPSIWTGRSLALIGILAVAANLRTAVASVSPIADRIAADIRLESVGLGVIGALPPVAFAVCGIFGGTLVRKVGLERLTVIVTAVSVVGHLIRAVAPDYPALFVGSVVIFGAIGISNVLLPPLVKRYFPDRIATVTTAYLALLPLTTAISSAVASPISTVAGWRVSLGIWSMLSAAALVPWLIVLVLRRRASRRDEDVDVLDSGAIHRPGRLVRSRTAWALAAVLAVSAFHIYACLSWLPGILTDVAGVTDDQAGALLAVYGVMGLPASLLVPALAVRFARADLIVQVGIAFFLVGYLGLLVAPRSAPLLWVIFIGLGPILFPVAMVQINLRSRTPSTSAELSGFVQAVGYAIGASGPLAIGALHGWTGGWTAPLAALVATALLCLIPASLLRRPTFVDDETA